ncbi:MAG: hypothetical protein AB1505_12610 [Candidatus Latescibacterota bacterium]
MTDARSYEVGDVPGHVIGLIVQKGLSFAESGEVGTCTGYITIDYINGKGRHDGYSVVTYDDGSTQLSRAQGSTTPTRGGKRSKFEGSLTYVGGTGRFKGMSGGGSYTGKRVAPLAEGADCYMDVTATYTLPDR